MVPSKMRRETTSGGSALEAPESEFWRDWREGVTVKKKHLCSICRVLPCSALLSPTECDCHCHHDHKENFTTKAISTLTNKYLENALAEINADLAARNTKKIGPTSRIIRECAGCDYLRTHHADSERRFACTHEKSVETFGDCNSTGERAAYTGATAATGPVTPEWCPEL